MTPLPAEIQVVKTYLMWKDNIKNFGSIYLPTAQKDLLDKRDDVVAVMQEYQFNQGKNIYSPELWNDIMNVVYTKDLYGNLGKLSKEVEQVQTTWKAGK